MLGDIVMQFRTVHKAHPFIHFGPFFQNMNFLNYRVIHHIFVDVCMKINALIVDIRSECGSGLFSILFVQCIYHHFESILSVWGPLEP